MPGATETDFFARADMTDTKIGSSKKDDRAHVATEGFEAMLNGEGDVVTGWLNKLQTAIADILPSGVLAERSRRSRARGASTDRRSWRSEEGCLLRFARDGGGVLKRLRAARPRAATYASSLSSLPNFAGENSH